jgi:chromosome segregation ATPase
MAFSNDDFANRGLDSGAVKMLRFKKDARDRHAKSLGKDRAQQQLNALRARLTVLEREIERLHLTERRNVGEKAQARNFLNREQGDVLAVTKLLQDETLKFEKIQLALGKEKTLVSRIKSLAGQRTQTDDVARTLASLRTKMSQIDTEARSLEAERAHIMSELTQVERQMNEVKAKRDRVMHEVNAIQNTKHTSDHGTQVAVAQLKEHETVLSQLLSEHAQHDSSIRQLKARLSREEHEAHEKEGEVEQLETRLRGVATGIPSLEHDRAQIIKQIEELERQIRAASE